MSADTTPTVENEKRRRAQGRRRDADDIERQMARHAPSLPACRVHAGQHHPSCRKCREALEGKR